MKESRTIENIPANELDLPLSEFFISARKQDGTEHELCTSSGFQRSFQRQLREKGSLINKNKNKWRCPVEFYKVFRSHRSEAMLDPDAPFYLAVNHRRKPSDEVGYLDRPLGKNEIGKFLKNAFASAKLDETNKKVSNHSVRKTSVGRLLEADVQTNFVAQLSGHKNLKSLDS